MSYVTFDCSQFIAFNSNKAFSDEALVGFQKMGFKVLHADEIAEIKLEYLEGHLQGEIVELLDQEFLGVFEEWRDQCEPPRELILLKNTIVEFCNLVHAIHITIVFISSASENIDDDIVVERTVNIDQFYDGLFLLSKWNFNDAVDNLILTVSLSQVDR